MVSNWGRIKSLSRKYQPNDKIIKLCKNKQGKKLRYSISLFKNDISKRFYVHSLVLEAFIGPRPRGMECRHLDGNPQNNKLENLKWGTKKENQHERIIHNTSNTGSKNGMSKLMDKDIIIMRTRYENGEFGTKIAEDYNMDISGIYKILRKETWKHIK